MTPAAPTARRAAGARLREPWGRYARGVAIAVSLIGLALSLVIWMHLPGDGSMAFVERAAWAPSNVW